MIQVRRALLSTYHKESLEQLASALVEVGAEILSTGGTHRWLSERGFPVVPLEKWADLPSLFGGRLKTLHPKIHGGILYRRGDPGDEEQRVAAGIEPIDLVAIHLYPFTEQIRREPDARDAAIEMIDIGGPAMLRAAAKNHRSVAVVCDPNDYGRVGDALRAGEGKLEDRLLRELAAKVFRTTACYDAAIAGYLHRKDEVDSLPAAYVRGEPLRWRLRYGENPSQRGAFYGTKGGFPGGLRKLQGKEISFNNLQDLDAAVLLVRDLSEGPSAVVIKHATPCGAAHGDTLVNAYRLARATDSLSAFGGVVALNRPVDLACAEELASTFLEVVAAPSFDEGACKRLSRKKNLILLEGAAILEPPDHAPEASGWSRSVGDGILLQDTMPASLGETEWRVVSKRKPDARERDALMLGWKVVRAVRSNGIVLSGAKQILGIGGGQTSRIDALWIAKHKAQREGHDLTGAVMASDAFFPFPDCVEEAGKAGITAIIQPGGSKRDGESIEAADRLGIAMIINDARCFRHA